jgi:lysophospholipase L1-like esterase
MRMRNVTIVAMFGIVFGSVAAATSSAEPAPGSTYLALGDSLAASYQPSGDMHSGYAEQILQLEQVRLPDLRLVKLACPGERTNTMDVPKKRCPYAEGTQLAQALAVLERRDVAFVTLQIGANDLLRCFGFPDVAFDQACVDDRLPKISARLTSIVGTLREAAGPDVPIVGANYYDPLLAAWTIPGLDHDAVVAIADVWTSFNDMLEQTYAALGVPVADVEAAFSTTDFDTIVHVRGVGDVPLNVGRTCQWTYACSESFDPHPNTIGYAAMTRAWEAALVTVLEAAPVTVLEPSP